MKISKQTLAIMKNFAQITPELIVDEKFILKTGIGATFDSSRISVLAVADIPEEFPDFYIFDLNKLLQSINLFDLDKLEVEFDDHYIILKEGNREVKILKSGIDTNSFKPKEAQKIKYPKVKYNATFQLTNEQITSLKNAANSFKAQENHFKIEIKNGTGILKVTNFENVSSDIYTETIKIDKKMNAEVIIDLNDVNLIAGDYEVSVCDNTVIKFENKELNLIYQIMAMNIRETE